MNIPIENVYYLLCYAWDKLEEKEVVSVTAIDCPSLADLLARVLISGTHHLVKRGLDRAYVAEHEWTARLRGRIAFSELIKCSAVPTGKLPCDFDELSHDILHNQILKATFRRLMRLSSLAPENGEALAHLYRLFASAGIRDIELSARVFGRVQLHRNNHFYDFLLKVCELTYRNLLASETQGESQFADFVRDEKQMAVLFEEFVRNFYRHETSYLVRREHLHWRWLGQDEQAEALLPLMRTDISLVRDKRKIIIDCKYTPKVFSSYYDTEKLRAGHLYQINAYMTNLPDDELSARCEMILLYPTVGVPVHAAYRWQGHRISIRTINLNQPWPKIHDDLLALVA